MPLIKIGRFVSFASNYGVMIGTGAEQLSPEELHRQVSIALKHINDPLLEDACCGARGPFKDYSELDFEEYLRLSKKFESEQLLAAAARKAKTTFTRIRRSSFNANRAHLVLEMIERRIPYKCSHPECAETDDLTVDHIVALSKGGTDEISNLRFMCRSHNSAKGDASED